MGEMIVLRIVHVVGGMLWVGSAIFNAIYLFPALTEAGPAAGPIMASLQRRRLFIAMPVVALLTILSGLRLYFIRSGGSVSAYFSTGPGATYAFAGAASILAFGTAIAVMGPTARRMGMLRQSLAGEQDAAARTRISDEVNRLQRRTTTTGYVVNLLLVIAAIGMAIGRYTL